METAAEIAVDLYAKYDKLERQLATAGTRVDSSLSGMESRGRAFATRFTAALGGVSAIALAGELARLADASKQMDAQLRLATATFGTYGKAQEDVRKIAGNTRSSIEATSSLYGNFVRATQQMGGSQEDAARATETFSKALKIGGADSAAAASATTQFSQALASGVLRGDEFNSVMEASPRIARLLADSLGVPIGSLRGLAEQGKITRDVLFRALTEKRFTSGIDAEFKQLPATFGDAMTSIRNAAITTFGAFDKGGQFSNSIVNMLQEGTTTFQGLEKLATDYGIEVRSVFDGLSTVFDPLVAAGGKAFDNITSQAHYARDTIAQLLRAFDAIPNLAVSATNAVNAAGNAVKDQFRQDHPFLGRFVSPNVAPIKPYDNAGVYLASQRQSEQERRLQTFLSNSGLAPGKNPDGTLDLFPFLKKQQPGRLAPAATGTPKPGKKASVSDKSAADKVLSVQDLVKKLAKDLDDVDGRFDRLFADGRSALDRAGANFRSIFGDEGDSIAKNVSQYDEDRDKEIDARADAENMVQRIREDNVRSLASLYEDAFQGGTDAIWRNFEDQGLRAVAMVLAQATIASFGKGGGGLGSLIGNIGSAASSVFGGGSGLPRLAGGGNIRAGGMGGVDRNVLSVNGVPRAMIGAHETLSVANPNIGAINTAAVARPANKTTIVNQNFSMDMRGAMTFLEFVAGFKDYVDTKAAQGGKAAYDGAIRDTPDSLARFQNLKK